MLRDFFLGFVKVHILHHAAQAPVYGLALIGELRRHGYELSPGTLYPVLHGLEREGYVTREERIVAGKVRKYYAITPEGAAALEEARAKIRELVDELLEGRGPEAVPGPAVSGAVVGEAGDLIDPDTLRAQQKAGAAPVVLDVRGSEEYAAGHLPSARHIPGGELAGRLDELPRDRLVVTYCTMRHRGDSRSERAAALLRERGYMARTLDGGLPAWEAAGLPIERGH